MIAGVRRRLPLLLPAITGRTARREPGSMIAGVRRLRLRDRECRRLRRVTITINDLKRFTISVAALRTGAETSASFFVTAGSTPDGRDRA